MSINNIKLTGALLSELYRNTLIEEPGIVSQKKTEQEPFKESIEQGSARSKNSFKWLGNNNKNILVMVKYPESVHLPDAGLKFLTGILGACKLGLDDVAILNLFNHPETTFKGLSSYFQSRVVLLFDIEPSSIELPLNFPHFQLQAFANSTFLYSPCLEELEQDKVLKSKLWVCLKRLFNL